MIIKTGECTDNCTTDKFFNGICKIYSDAPLDIKSIIIDKIRNDLLNGKIKSLKIVTLNHNDLLIKDGNIVYQITSSFNQINNKYENISTINLGECERKIRDIYGLDDNEDLIIFKIEYYEEKLLIPVIEYEIYHIDKKIKIDLNICKDKDILLSIPVKINESELFKHDPNGGFYNDICYPYTTQFKTDITISDRRNEFKYNNLSLCEKNCQFRGYDSEKKKVKCSCKAKNEIRLFEIIDIDKDKLFSKFTDINKLTNIFVIKCYYVFFTKNGFIKNIGSYILLFFIFLFLISIIIFWQREYEKLMALIEKVINKKIKSQEIKIQEKILTEHIIVKKKNVKTVGDEDSMKNEKEKKRKITLDGNKYNNSSSLIKIEKEKSQDLAKPLKEKTKFLDNSNNKKEEFNDKELNDNEINSLEYDKSLKIDHRTYIQYYLSLLRTKHLLIFSFYSSNDYNSLIMKIDLFFVNFSLYYVVNGLFFTDSTMHKIYEEKGTFDFIYEIPKTIYSTIITVIINKILKLLSLTENNVLELKKEKVDENFLYKVQKEKKNITIKFYLFFVFSFLFLCFFWYYLGCFCAVFYNTQGHLIKDTLLSFAISLVYPLAIYLMPGIFRIPSLKQKNKETLYKFSKIVQLL